MIVNPRCFAKYIVPGIAALLVFTVIFSGCSSLTKPKPSSMERAQILIQVAYGTLLDGDPTGALQTLHEAEELDNDVPELFHVRALAYHAKNEDGLAIEAARRAIKIKPDFSGAKTTLGKLLLDTGKWDEAIIPLTEASADSLNRDNYKAMTTLGIIYYKQMNFPKAKTYFNKAVSTEPVGSCVAYYYLGHMELKDGLFADAQRNYDHATQKICGGFAEAHLAKGIAFERSKDYLQARKAFLMVQQRFPHTKIAEEAISHYRGLP